MVAVKGYRGDWEMLNQDVSMFVTPGTGFPPSTIPSVEKSPVVFHTASYVGSNENCFDSITFFAVS
jgi:hypothetical protein